MSFGALDGAERRSYGPTTVSRRTRHSSAPPRRRRLARAGFVLERGTVQRRRLRLQWGDEPGV